MKKFIILVAVIIILIFLGYARWGNYLWGGSSMAPKPVIIIPLVAQNDSNEMGEAILTEVEGQIKVELKMAKVTVDPQSADINRGRCDVLGESVYSLHPVINGSSVTIITASFVALEANLPLAISAHNSCGDLILE